jgi:glyoxylase-like metal-dependent hydrolase (beta-lactamase superfamily II)
MRLTKYGHACVTLTKDDSTLVIDPGGLTPERDALTDADAVLVTHEHFDHFAEERLRQAAADNRRLTVWTCRPVAESLDDLGDRVRVVGDGDAVTVAGFDVEVHGELHEVVHPDVPPVPNIGFLVDVAVFHPGDAFTVPGRPVPTLLVPTSAPWLKLVDVIGYLREVAPGRAYSVHDGLLNDAGLGLVDSQLAGEGERAHADFRRLRPGERVDLDPA